MSYWLATMDSVQSVREALEKWNGCNARIWSYSASHSILVVRLKKEGEGGNLHINCLGVASISGRVTIPDCRFEVSSTVRGGSKAGDHMPMLLLRVGGDGLKVLCEDLVLKKNIAPVY